MAWITRVVTSDSVLDRLVKEPSLLYRRERTNMEEVVRDECKLLTRFEEDLEVGEDEICLSHSPSGIG